MTAFRRVLILVAAMVLGVVAIAPAASAARSTTITVSPGLNYEYLPTCSNVAPYPCTQQAQTVVFRVYTSRTYNHPITVGWQLVNGSAVAGSDFTGPTSGTVTIAAHASSNEVVVPLVNDGFGESTETFTARATSASVPANLSSVGTQTILDGSRIPADCTLSKNDPGQLAMTCTNRPAGQRWYLYNECFYGWGDPAIRGNDVIGNGTSAGVCGFGSAIGNAATFNVW